MRHLALASLGLLLACSSAATSTPGTTPDAGVPEPVVTPPAPVPDPVGFRASGKLRTARAIATATKLADGRILVVGGEDDDDAMLASVEIYDPTTATSTLAAPLPEARSHHTATLLRGGRVLVTGGGRGSRISLPSGEGTLASAVIYDPSSNTWAPTGPMSGKRAGHRAVALPDGRVLVAGGGDRVGYPCAATYPNCTVAESLDTVEIYDPATGTFSKTASLANARLAFSMDLVAGKVVVTGGGAKNQGLTGVEIFDPATGQWSRGPDLDGQRLFHASTPLGDSLLVVGGKIANVAPINHADLLDRGASAWRRGASIEIPRTGATLVALPSGKALLVGGFNQKANVELADCRLYDPATNAWATIGGLAAERSTHSTVVLDDGSVVVVGGRSSGFVVADVERSRTE
ncbi:MAG: hypothetical protein JST00_19705 [Deltaproteobacteria bacterium]|nr:hypothetical protein [Deltaproteobacteria bacterium]